MIDEKPEWWKPENEKEPGNPLSRIPEWDITTFIGDHKIREAAPAVWSSILESRIRELLAVIDRQSDTIHMNWGQIKALREMLADAEERERKAFEAGRSYDWKQGNTGPYTFSTFADYLATQATEKEK